MACMNTYALMKCNFVCSKFAHISKDGNSSSKSVLKNIQRSFHGHRICIVAVIYDHELVSLDHIESSTDRFQTFDTVFDLLCIQSVKSSDSCCRQCIGYHMASRHWNLHVEFPELSVLCHFSLETDIATHSFQSAALHIFAGNGSIFSVSEKYRLDAVVFFYSREFVVIAVEYDVFLHIFKDLCFCLQDTVSVPKIFQVAGSDVCDHAGVRFRDFCKAGHLTEITDSHFQNCNLVLITEAEYSQRKSQLIIEISLGFQCAVFLFQDRSDHLFCAGFSNTSCNSHNRNLQLLQIKLRNVFYCLKRRFYLNVRIIRTFKDSLG